MKRTMVRRKMLRCDCVSFEVEPGTAAGRPVHALVTRVMLEVEVECDHLETVEEAVDVLPNEQGAEHLVHESHVGRWEY